MNTYGHYLLRFVVVVTVSFMVAGCSVPYTMKTSEIAMLQTGTPLKSVPPKIFAFKEFIDTRGGNPYLYYYWMFHKYKLDKPAATFAALATRKELERNGHTCIAYSPESKSDFIIEGSVTKFSFMEIRGRGVMAYVSVKLTVSPASPGKGFLSKIYEGESTRFRFNHDEKDRMNEAMLAMVKEMSTDPELIALLEK